MSLTPPRWRCQHGAMCLVQCPGCPGPNIGTIASLPARSSGEVIADIERTIAEMHHEPNPMAGVTELVCHENMKDAAFKLAAAFSAGPWPRQITVRVSPMMLPGHIMGTRPARRSGPWHSELPEAVFLVRPDDSNLRVTFIPTGHQTEPQGQ